MIDIEQRLRELGEKVDPVAATPNLPSPRTLKRIKVRQRAISLVSIGAVAIVVGSFLMWGPSFHLSIGSDAGAGVNSGGPGQGPSPTPTLPRGWVEHHTSTGVSIATPRSWFVRGGRPTVRRPRLSFAVGTWRFPSGNRCPPRALHAVPRGGMFLYMSEYSPIGVGPYPPRPSSFDLGPSKGSFECLGTKVHVVQFREHDRSFQIYVKFGLQASQALRREVTTSLNSIRVARP
jgi:hypothetical protein